MPEQNFIQKVYKKLFSGVPVAKLKASAYMLSVQCTSVELEPFLQKFSMPDTYYSWFLVAELHIWLIAVRLMREGDTGRMVRNFMCEALWMDCDNRAKAIGDMAASTRKANVVSIAEEFQAALFVYDEGLLGNDMQLANALWRRFFLSMHEEEEEKLPDPEQLELLVSYVRRVTSYLDKEDAVDIIVKNKIQWPSLVV